MVSFSTSTYVSGIKHQIVEYNIVRADFARVCQEVSEEGEPKAVGPQANLRMVLVPYEQDMTLEEGRTLLVGFSDSIRTEDVEESLAGGQCVVVENKDGTRTVALGIKDYRDLKAAKERRKLNIPAFKAA